MELLAVVALILVVYWWVKSSATATRRRDAGAFTYDSPDGYSSYVVNFTTARVHYLWSPPNPDPMDRDGNRDYELRREQNGRWVVRLTNDSWARSLQDAKADQKSTSPTLRERAAASLKALGDEPVWEPVDRELVPLVESRYQTFLEVFGRIA